MMLSECCDSPPWGDMEEYGICGECKEHCEFYDTEKAEAGEREFTPEQEAIIAELMKPCCVVCGDPVARFSDGGTLHHQTSDGKIDGQLDYDHPPRIKEG